MHRNLEYERFLQIQAEDHGTLKDDIILEAIDHVLYVQHLLDVSKQIDLEKWLNTGLYINDYIAWYGPKFTCDLEMHG